MASPPLLAYNWLATPLWDTNPSTNVFNSTNKGSTYGGQFAPYTQDWVSGYDATASNAQYSSPNRTATSSQVQQVWQNLLNHSNANFCNAWYHVPLFVNAIQIDLGISGSTAQGRLTRDFYPHNITIPSFTISGQCYSTAHYGSLIEYIHMAQHDSLTNFNGSSNLIQFYLAGNAHTSVAGNRKSGPHVEYKGHPKAYNQKIVGGHHETMCLGYISTIARTHTAGEHRPTWTADFVVAQMLRSPLFTEQQVSEKETNTWLKILSGTKSQDWLNKQNEANNVKTLKSVAAGANGAISSLGTST